MKNNTKDLKPVFKLCIVYEPASVFIRREENAHKEPSTAGASP